MSGVSSQRKLLKKAREVGSAKERVVDVACGGRARALSAIVGMVLSWVRFGGLFFSFAIRLSCTRLKGFASSGGQGSRGVVASVRSKIGSSPDIVAGF